MTTEQGSSGDLERRVLAELLALRKRPSGVSVETISEASTICALLGAGDPFVAYSKLRHEVLESEPQLPIRAAAASLGLTSDAGSHLQRMDEFGAEVHLEQRQVRRYSDRGVSTLARLIATNWTVENVPQLTALVSCDVARGWKLHLSTLCLLAVEMRQPYVVVLVGSAIVNPPSRWTVRQEKLWRKEQMSEPIALFDREEEISVMITWRGELWPKWNVIWQVGSRQVGSESLGNKLALRLKPP